jgi:hypothetical protein
LPIGCGLATILYSKLYIWAVSEIVVGVILFLISTIAHNWIIKHQYKSKIMIVLFSIVIIIVLISGGLILQFH